MKKSILSILLISIIMQSIVAVTPVQLDSSFTRFKRGLNCFVKRKPCKEEDKRVVYQVGGTLLIVLGLVFAKWLSIQQSTINPFLTVQERELLHQNQEILALPLNQQQETKNEYLLDAIAKSNLKEVQFWLAHGANPNAYFDQGKLTRVGFRVEYPGHLLNTAIHNFSMRWQHNEPREESKKIIIELIKQGANPHLPSRYRRLGDPDTEQLSVYKNHKGYTPYYADAELDQILEKGNYP